MNLKPTQLYNFLNTIARKLPWIIVGLLVWSGYEIIAAPADYIQGVYAKIMYIHIPSAWLALACYLALSGCSAIYLAGKNLLFDMQALAFARIGSVFCFITLITGALWGKPTWGVYWAWDARLTSMLILQVIYICYLLIKQINAERQKVAFIASIFALVGFINIPVIKFSVDLWSTLHQGASVFRSGGPSIHGSMLQPLIISFLAMLSIMLYACCLETMQQINAQKSRNKAHQSGMRAML